MDDIRAILLAHEASYRPSEEVTEQLKLVTLAAIIGPVAVGKTTSVDQVTLLDNQFGRVRSFATRPRRPDESDDEYRFDNQESYILQQTALMVRTGKGDLVQYGVHPTTGHIYGSKIGDYDHPYMMVVTLSHIVETLRRLPFKKMIELTIVTEPDVWKKRVEDRHFSADELHKRLQEGKQSLEWSLNQPESMPWVCTPSDVRPETAVEIRDLIKGTREPNLQNRTIGERLLKTISHLV